MKTSLPFLLFPWVSGLQGAAGRGRGGAERKKRWGDGMEKGERGELKADMGRMEKK